MAQVSSDAEKLSMSEIFWYFLKLGWHAFGGPIGQIGVMHLEVVERGITVVTGLAAFFVLTFWKWRLNVVVVVLAGGVLGIVRAFAPGIFGGSLS